MKSRRSKVEGRMPKCRLLWSVVTCFAWSALAQEEAPKLQPPLGEIPPTFWEQHGVTVILGVGGVVLFVVLAIWFWLRPRPAEAVAPEVEARNALEALSKRPEDGDMISRVSQILRHYVLTVFELPPGQPTTAEFCSLVSQSDKVGNELSRALASFLCECDERKFALKSPGELGAVTQALRLVKQAELRKSLVTAEKERVA